MRSWPLWIVVIAVASGPWFGFVRQPQWDRVTWIPFRGAEDRPKDVAVNFLLFLPFGWSFAKSRNANAVASAIGAAAAVSLVVEASQLFYRLRDPSATDVFMAMCGAGAGSFASQAFSRNATRSADGQCQGADARGNK
jgi:glycopeptide antibiotics resistance protein